MSSDDVKRGQPGPANEAERPHIQVTDPTKMRALAHPMRVALLEAIGMADGQTLTATQASELLGESPANCAFHLRTLAKYGFVEEAGGGRGRERPWRLRYRGLEIAPPWQDSESRLAVEAAAGVWIGRWLDRARDRVMRTVGYPAEWQEAAMASQGNLYLTAQEAAELSRALHEQMKPYEPRWTDPSLRPPGSLPYEVLVFGYPLTDPPEPPGPAETPRPAEPGPAGPATAQEA
jgi:predicted transcriptional regulator